MGIGEMGQIIGETGVGEMGVSEMGVIPNNKGADKPAHLRSLISDFVIRCLDSIISLVSNHKISSLYLASVAAQVGLCQTCFLMTGLIYVCKTLVTYHKQHFQ